MTKQQFTETELDDDFQTEIDENQLQSTHDKSRQKKSKGKNKQQSRFQGDKQKQKAKFSWPIYKKMLNYTLKQWPFALLGFSFTLLAGVLNALMPLKMGQILDAIGTTTKEDPSPFLGKFYVLFTLMIFIVIGSLCRTIFMKLLQERIAIDMRVQIFRKLLRNDMKFFQQYRSGQFVTRLVGDINEAKSAITNNLNGLLRSLVTTFGNLIMLVLISWKLSIATFVMVPIYLMVSTYYTKRNKILTKKHKDIMAEMGSHIAQKFGGIQIIKAFCTEQYQSNKYAQINDRSYKIMKSKVVVRSLYVTCSQLLPKITTLIALYFGGYFIIDSLQKDVLTVGELTSFILYCTALNSNVSQISKGYSNIINGTQAVQKVFEMLNYQPQIDQTEEGNMDKINAKIKGQITLNSISFNYPSSQAKVLNDISLRIKQGQCVAIVGESGSGKSTIVKILQRFYNAQKGFVKFGNHISDMINIHSLRSQISLVNQQSSLFSGTIEENIVYGMKDYSLEEVEQVAKQSGCYQFISDPKKFPKGFQTQIGEKGSQVSGGQRQRIAIARALIRKPKILILDQATSALDINSQALVQKSIENISKNHEKMTIIIIAHRLSTVKNASRIVVMKNGQVIQIGNHKELKQKKGYYYELVQKQLSQEDQDQLS